MKENFSTTVNVSSTYAGQKAAGYISASLLSADTLDKSLITVHPNVVYKEVLSVLDASSLVKDYGCEFTSSGTISLSEVVLEPKRLSIEIEICKSEFDATWEALQMGYSAFKNIPAEFNDYLISYIGAGQSEATEKSIWLGKATNNGEFEGIIPLLLASEDTLEITGSTITASNVIDVLEAVYNKIPDTLYGKEDLRIFVSQKVAKAYFSALANSTNGGYMQWMTVDAKPLNYQGIKLEVVSGLVGDYAVAARISNLHFGTGLMSDFNLVKVLDMSEILGSDTYRILMKWTAGVEVAVKKEVVIYHV